MARCWEQRDCDEEMQSYCAHACEFMDRCPTKCAFANCQRPTREITTDPALIFDPSVDRRVAAKEVCLHCGFFLTNGPRLDEEG